MGTFRRTTGSSCAKAHLGKWSLSLSVIFSASLILNNAAMAQTDVTWNGGNGNWNVGANWDLGSPPDNGGTTYNVFIDGGNAINSQVNLNQDATIEALTIDLGDLLTINNGRELTINNGTLHNDGT